MRRFWFPDVAQAITVFGVNSFFCAADKLKEKLGGRVAAMQCQAVELAHDSRCIAFDGPGAASSMGGT